MPYAHPHTHQSNPILTTVIAAIAVAGGSLAIADTGDVMIVTQDDTVLRVGGADAFYPIGYASAGDSVHVIGARYGWAHVITEGPTFSQAAGIIRYPIEGPVAVEMTDDMTSGTLVASMPIFGLNATATDLRQSWRPIGQIDAGEEVLMLDTWTTEAGNPWREGSVVHVISLPKATRAWINMANLRPATGEEIAAWDPDATSGVTIEPVVLVNVIPVEPVVIQEVVAEPDPGEQLLAHLEEVDAKMNAIKGMTPSLAVMGDLRTQYLMLVDDATKYRHVAAYARSRADQLSIMQSILQTQSEIESINKSISHTATEARERILALETGGHHIATGRLARSRVYSGQDQPLLFRVEDPRSARTIMYIRPVDGLDVE